MLDGNFTARGLNAHASAEPIGALTIARVLRPADRGIHAVARKHVRRQEDRPVQRLKFDKERVLGLVHDDERHGVSVKADRHTRCKALSIFNLVQGNRFVKISCIRFAYSSAFPTVVFGKGFEI